MAMATMTKAIRPAPGGTNAGAPSMPKPVRIAPSKASLNPTAAAQPASAPKLPRIAMAPRSSPFPSASPALAKPPLIAPSPAASTASTDDSTPSSGSTAGTPAPAQTQGGTVLQPSQTWVLPARAKPGRKPSEEEPPTKRKAQNRASQRAFRERKQSYLASLEAKVQAYEDQGIQQSVELQKAAQKVKDENEVLKRENGKLKAQCAHLIKVLQGLGWNGSSKGSVKNVGCRPPSHEGVGRSGASTAAPSMAGSPPRSRASSVTNRVQSSGAVAAPVTSPSGNSQKAPKPAAQAVVAPAQAPPTAPPAISSFTAPKASNSSTPAPITCTGSTHTCACAPSQQACAPKPTVSAKDRRASLGGIGETEAPLSSGLDMDMAADRNCGFCTADVPCLCAGEAVLDFDGDEVGKGREGSASQEPFPPVTAASTSIDDAVPATKGGQASTSAAVPIRLRRREQAVSLGSMLNDDAPPQRISTSASTPSSSQNKLWHTVAAAAPSLDGASLRKPLSNSLALRRGGKTTLAPLSHLENARLAAAQPPKPRLWHVESGSIASSASQTMAPPTPTAVCSGDPSSCSACSSDPGLAAFCEAVSSDTPPARASKDLPPSATSTRSAPSQGPSTSIVLPSLSGRTTTSAPLWRVEAATGSGGREGAQTIPEAWHRIRNHPGFQRLQAFEGGETATSPGPSTYGLDEQTASSRPGLPMRRSAGLDMLADVVAGRTDAGLMGGTDEDGQMQREVPSPERRTSSERTSGVGIKRRHATKVEDAAGETADGVEGSEAGGTSSSKRRRLYVEGDRVRLALALLDRGILSPSSTGVSPSSSTFASGSRSAGAESMERIGSAGAESQGGLMAEKMAPCPCPWWKSEPAPAPAPAGPKS